MDTQCLYKEQKYIWSIIIRKHIKNVTPPEHKTAIGNTCWHICQTSTSL